MVYLSVSGRGSLALIVLPDQADPLVVWQDHFTAEHLSDLLLGSDPDDKEGYLLAAWSDDITGFRSMLDEVLRVAQDLWRPIGERLRDMGHRQAILIPVGLLAQLPMQAGAPSELVVSCAPSAQAVQACEMAASKRARGMPAFVGVGNPMPHPQPLLFAREEVREIAHYFDEGRQVLLCEEQATQERLFSALPGASHLHFACHGHFHPSRPLDSTLFLAEGGQLSLRDVLDGRLALSTLKLAVLSACQTGVTDFLGAPYEAFGFTTAFLRAGVPGVVSALWPVNDLSTALLFGEFYRHHVGDGVAPAAALGRAQRWLRDGSARELALADRYEQLYLDSGELDEDALHAMHHFRRHPDVRPFEHPYFWAAFVFTGLAAPSR
jgi:CHAT domain-containing protein